VRATAWSRLGLAHFGLGVAWQADFAAAYAILKNKHAPKVLARILLNEGYCLSQSGDHRAATLKWVKALPHAHQEPKLKMWLHCNIGLSGLRDLDPEAEQHLLTALALGSKAATTTLRTQVLNGLAAYRRYCGEWQRAEAGYRQALETAPTTSRDYFEAYRSLVRTLRLAQRPTEALTLLEMALEKPIIMPPFLYLERALIYLFFGNTEAVQTNIEYCLKHINSQEIHNAWLLRIAQAELARLQNQPQQACFLLVGLPTDTLQMREEACAFPALMQLLQANGQTPPVPLPYPERTQVEVLATGLLQVKVNGRAVPCPPTGRVAELLVFLLEHGGRASNEQIGDAMYPTTDPKQLRKAINKQVQLLRAQMGWPDSVLSHGGGYELDPSSHWHYDIAQARARGRFRGDFLAGIYSQWALDTATQLENLDQKPSSLA
jgi:tetratricopeptide (TPR) repeat protein